ncbi:hypothetical protein GIB67_026775, partial [Kingdonia uniflora]
MLSKQRLQSPSNAPEMEALSPNDVPVVLIDMHNCSLDSKIKMNLGTLLIQLLFDVKKVPNAPKRPSTAFCPFHSLVLFAISDQECLCALDDFWKTFKETHPGNKSASVVGKEGGGAWRAMGEEEKQTYLDRVAELKEEYIVAMEKYKADNENDEVEVIE